MIEISEKKLLMEIPKGFPDLASKKFEVLIESNEIRLSRSIPVIKLAYTDDLKKMRDIEKQGKLKIIEVRKN